MKFFSKLVKSASAFVAAAIVAFSGSSAFAEGNLRLWKGGRTPANPPSVFVKKAKTTSGKEVYIVKKNPGAYCCGQIKQVSPNQWVYIDSEKAKNTVTKVSDSKYISTHYDNVFEMTFPGNTLEKHGDEWWMKSDDMYLLCVPSLTSSRINLFDYDTKSRICKIVEPGEFSSDMVAAMIILDSVIK